jgi:hypothetical protein
MYVYIYIYMYMYMYISMYLSIYLSISTFSVPHPPSQPCCPPTIDALPSANDDRLHSRHSWLDCQYNFANAC